MVLGDSTAQGLGAPSPEGGYVGQVLDVLRRRSGLPWRVLNLSASGALMRDVLNHQLPRLPASAELVTCGIGFNDVLYSGPGRLLADLRALLAAVPDDTVVLDLPIPAGYAGLLGRASPALPGADQPDHPPGGRPPGPAGGPGIHALPAALGREVRVRLLPTPTKTATATGPGPCSPSCETRPAGRWPTSGP